MDKPTDEEISKAIRHSIKHRAASPVLYEAFDVLYRYRAWADAELELAARQEKSLSKRVVDQRAQLASLEHLRYNHDQAVRERSFVSQELADANEKIRVLQADVAKGQNEFDRRLKAKDARIEDSERMNRRLVSKACDSCGRATNRIAGPRWVPEDSVPVSEAELEARIARLDDDSTPKGEKLRTAEEQQAQLDEMVATLNASQPKGKSYADAELGVIQDCLEALARIPAAQRAAITQYLTSRSHTAAWGAIPQQPVMPPW